jgi:hypothetical protein
MQKMERFRGHFYNWYDTETLAPLMPRYISTVDSGNLVGHLLTAKQGLLAIPHQFILDKKIFEGVRDTWYVLKENLKEKDNPSIEAFGDAVELACGLSFEEPQTVSKQLKQLSTSFSNIFFNVDETKDAVTMWWKETLSQQISEAQEELESLAPWMMLVEAPQKFVDFAHKNGCSTLIELIDSARILAQMVLNANKTQNTIAENDWLLKFDKALKNSIHIVEQRLALIESLAAQFNELSDVEWSFLYNKTSNLFTIGYNVHEHQCDNSYYDLLASEARLGTFIGIAQGKLPEESWFALGRLLTNVDGSPILLSWSGSMFEYLMPHLVMPTYENTLLYQSCKSAVEWQIKYGKKIGLPWGISESGYNMVNANSSYQYRAFGAPGLGLKRGLDDDFVVAPYASALALMVNPEKACENLETLSNNGFEGRYGFYEAIDYTVSRLAPGESSTAVTSFMAHHQGMSLLSFAYLLLDKPMQKLFEAEPQFKATLLLLQERIPRASTFYAHTTDIADINSSSSGIESRSVNTPNTRIPEVQLLSNGRYHVMVSNAGAGYSRWKDLAVTRWREDGTRDHWGNFCYIHDLKNDDYWSNTYQPVLKKSEKYETINP